MGTYARLGVLCLMALAIALARLVEVELRPEAPLAIVQDTAHAGTARPGPAPEEPPGAPAGVEPASSAAEPAPGRTYVVRSGDTLDRISKRVYGSARHWKRLLAANRDVIPDPNRMKAGIRLEVPPLERDSGVGARD